MNKTNMTNTETVTLIEELYQVQAELEYDNEYQMNKYDILEREVHKKEELFNFDSFQWIQIVFEDGSTIIVGQDKQDPITEEYLNSRYADGYPISTFKIIVY